MTNPNVSIKGRTRAQIVEEIADLKSADMFAAAHALQVQIDQRKATAEKLKRRIARKQLRGTVLMFDCVPDQQPPRPRYDRDAVAHAVQVRLGRAISWSEYAAIWNALTKHMGADDYLSDPPRKVI